MVRMSCALVSTRLSILLMSLLQFSRRSIIVDNCVRESETVVSIDSVNLVGVVDGPASCRGLEVEPR